MDLTAFEKMDPHLLVGLVNTELRNNSDSLEDLCRTHDINQEKLLERLGQVGYEFIEAQKQFR